MNACTMEQIIDGKVYNTETAELIADNNYWDGHNFERSGRNRFLYKTRKGNFFTLNMTLYQGERDYIEPVGIEEAKHLYENELPEHYLEWEDAFDEQPEEA